MYSKKIIDKKDAKERCELLAEYFIENRATVREVAKKFSISKSTVHKDLAYKLSKINPALYYEVKRILDQNKSERHLRGGEATKRKYKILADTAKTSRIYINYNIKNR